MIIFTMESISLISVESSLLMIPLIFIAYYVAIIYQNQLPILGIGGVILPIIGGIVWAIAVVKFAMELRKTPKQAILLND
jgi:hypothetical protein